MFHRPAHHSFTLKCFSFTGHFWIKSVFTSSDSNSFCKPVIYLPKENFFTDLMSTIKVFRDISADCLVVCMCLYINIDPACLNCFYTIFDLTVSEFSLADVQTLNFLYIRQLALGPPLALLCCSTFRRIFYILFEYYITIFIRCNMIHLLFLFYFQELVQTLN